MKRISPAYSRI